MKTSRKSLSLFVIVCLLASVTSCISFGGGEDKGGETFLILHFNDQNKIGEGASLSALTIKKGEPAYATLNQQYPYSSLSVNTDIVNKRVAMGLHTDFNNTGSVRFTNGSWFDISSGIPTLLPILSAGDGRYSYLDVATPKVSKSGHIFYNSSSNDRSYHDQYRASLVRYDPKTDKLKQATDPSGFALSQPEKGWDTEAGQIVRQYYPSNDGRYVYGVIQAFGVDGGSIHWDYDILFKYDFEKDTYSRLGETEDKKVTILGITADRNYVLYTNSSGGKYTRKMVNVNTNNVQPVTQTGGQGYANTARWNNSGYCSGETNNTIGVYNIISDTRTNIKTPARPYYAQFSADGSFIYFMLDSKNGKYLCKTSDLTETATIDTITTLMSNVSEFMVIK